MNMKKLSQEVKEIEMSQDMKERIMNHCYHKMEEEQMSKNKTNKRFQKPMVAVASLAACFCLVGITTLAATGKLEGYFKDITRWDGAVVGTSYEQASDEIQLSVISVSDELTVSAEFVNPNVAPYKYFEAFGIEEYEIVTVDEKVVVKGETTDFAAPTDGKITITIPLSELPGGEYKLVVNSFVGSKKADQPLVLHGTWVCEFNR